MKKFERRNRAKAPALTDKELGSVNGGNFAITSNLNTPSCRHIHKNCGGEIQNVGKIFSYCKCKVCGLEHYWLYSFDYTTVYEDR